MALPGWTVRAGALNFGVVVDTTLPLAGDVTVVGFGCWAYAASKNMVLVSIVPRSPPSLPATSSGVPNPNRHPSDRPDRYDQAASHCMMEKKPTVDDVLARLTSG